MGGTFQSVEFNSAVFQLVNCTDLQVGEPIKGERDSFLLRQISRADVGIEKGMCFCYCHKLVLGINGSLQKEQQAG